MTVQLLIEAIVGEAVEDALEVVGVVDTTGARDEAANWLYGIEDSHVRFLAGCALASAVQEVTREAWGESQRARGVAGPVQHPAWIALPDVDP